MQRDVRKYLTDIAIHINYIDDFLTYDGVNNAIIWSVVINHLPILKVEINALLDELGSAE